MSVCCDRRATLHGRCTKIVAYRCSAIRLAVPNFRSRPSAAIHRAILATVFKQQKVHTSIAIEVFPAATRNQCRPSTTPSTQQWNRLVRSDRDESLLRSSPQVSKENVFQDHGPATRRHDPPRTNRQAQPGTSNRSSRLTMRSPPSASVGTPSGWRLILLQYWKHG